MTNWWERPDLRYVNETLVFGGQSVQSLVSASGTPVYLYDGERVKANLERLRTALGRDGRRFRVFYAMKANRCTPLLTMLRLHGRCGVDVCSPGELLLARQVGFHSADISFTGTALSAADLDCLARHPEVIINCDSLHAIAELGARCPGRRIGIRVNPALGIGYRDHEILQYAGTHTTKFGIYREEFPKALNLAAESGLTVHGIHFHCGCGYLQDNIKQWSRIMQSITWFLDQVPALDYVNVGGGLGIPLTESDQPLDLASWSEVVWNVLKGYPIEVCVEPGDYLVKDAGMLVLQVNMVERKRNQWFVGVDGGFNLHIEPAFYDLPIHPVAVKLDPSPARTHTFHVAGNINEALDLIAKNITMPLPNPGDFLAFLNAGGYGASMKSDHCLRNALQEYLL